MLLLLLAQLTALAGSPGHYHPTDVAAASELFATAQATSGVVFGERSEQSQALAASLNAFEEGLDLLGDRAPADQRDRFTALRQQYHRDFAVLQQTANSMLDAFDAAFGDALARALEGRELERCRVERASGPRFTRSARPAGPESCPGDDQNGALAATLDADPLLRADIDALTATEWPEFHLTAEPATLIGGSAGAVDVRRFLRSHANAGLAAIDRADEDARLEFQAALEDGAEGEALKGLVGEAQQVTATTAARRAELAAPVLAAAEANWARAAKKGPAAPGWCAQPLLLGGCTAAPVAPERVQATASNGKVRKALDKASAWRAPTP